jgi:2',3'-cyclic-nucleotide 2'-phosphodiesterase (5'-nucleotidase family)
MALPGKVVLAALEHGVAKLPDGAGQFLQVSGLTMRVNPSAPPGQRVSDVRVNSQPLDTSKTYTVAVPDFLLLCGDGFQVLVGQRVLVSPQSGPLMATALEKFISQRREVAPKIDGRIIITK